MVEMVTIELFRKNQIDNCIKILNSEFGFKGETDQKTQSAKCHI